MKASIIKHFFKLGYTLRQTSIIGEVTEDYARKIIGGKRAQSIEASSSEVTEGMRRRARTIDYVMSLRGLDGVSGPQKFNYISLLSYMGYTLDELRLLFPNDRPAFVGIAALRSGEAWRSFESELIGLPQEDYNFTFIEKVKTYEATVIESHDDQSEYLAARQAARMEKKMRNRALYKEKTSTTN